MKNIKWPFVFLIIDLAAIIWIVIRFLNLLYPMVGSDYSLAIPQLLDTALHFWVNGLSIQWYTPSFGGGVPAYPDPNNAQFSIVEILPLFVQPWQAVIISSMVYIGLGFFASYYLFFRVLKLHWTSSVLGAVFFSANGFMMERLAVGHLGYQTFPVFPILMLVLLDSSLPRFKAGLIFALVIAMLIHEAGYFIIVVFGLSILISFPLVYIFKSNVFSWKRIVFVAAFGGIIALLISASKLAAVYAFMRFFPRQIADNYPNNLLTGLFGLSLQLLGTMNLAPLWWISGSDPSLLLDYLRTTTGSPYGYWELDMSVSPVVFGILMGGIGTFFHNPKKYLETLKVDRKWIAWILFVLFTWITIEFTLAKGWIYPCLRTLPILSSLHVNIRFASAFIFPLALSATVIYNTWSAKWSSRKSTSVFVILNLLTLPPLGTYFMFKNDLQNRFYNITESITIYDAIRSGNTLDITGIGAEENNTQALSRHVSNLHPYDPIFGYNLEDFHPEIKAGSIWDVSDGYYNMTNPTGYVFPEINRSRPFERIRIEDKDKLDAFAKHYQPDWKIPVYQQVLNWLSGLTFVAVLISLVGRSTGLFGQKPR